jgi:hypothetical protein
MTSAVRLHLAGVGAVLCAPALALQRLAADVAVALRPALLAERGLVAVAQDDPRGPILAADEAAVVE